MSSKTSINSRIERGDFEVFPFQADVVKLLNHLVNTFYKNKDFFLRELLQNSADALDKLSTLTQGQPMYNERSSRGDCSSVGGKELCIYIIPDIQQKTLTIVDNGIGMTKREILSNLAGMTKSCIRSQSEKLRYSLALNDVEQCGVGFYSAYLVADKVTVYTKHCNDKAFVWESAGNGEFTLKVDIRNTTKRGTHVVLQMKPECMGYLDEINLITMGKTHSKHISYPVYFKMAKDRLIGIDTPIGFALPEQVIKTEQVQEYRNGLWRASRTQRKVFYFDIVHLNTSPQIWLREPYTATSDAYGEFYRALTNDPEPHRAVIHFEMEKPVKFHALFFIPQRAPANFMENARQQPNVKFYIGHEFYADNLSDLLLPDFLCFLRGVIDCGQFIEEDGHEMQYIRSSIAHKTLEMLAELKQNTEEYLGFFEEFGKYLKLGIIENEPLRDPLMNLLLFKTSFDPQHYCSLNDYVNRRKAKQPGIYCLNEVSLQRAVDSPFTEQVEAFQFEVVYMLEPLDEFALPLMRSYRGIPMIQCNKEELPLPSSRSTEMRRIAERGRFRALCALMQEILDWRIEKVVVSKRLCSSPSCVVTTAYGLTPGIQSTIAAQALANYCTPMMNKHNGDGLVLELNPNCKLMQALSRLCLKGDYEVVNYVFLLFDLSLLVSGYTLTQPAIYDLRVQRLIEKLLGIELEYDAQEFIDLTMSMEARA